MGDLASASTRGSDLRPVGWPVPLGVHAAQSRQARPEEAQEASRGTACRGVTLTVLRHSPE